MPVSESQYVIVISSKTGWSEEHIRWWLPLGRGWAHYHTARMLEGEKMRFPGCDTRADAWFDQVEGRLDTIRKRKVLT